MGGTVGTPINIIDIARRGGESVGQAVATPTVSSPIATTARASVDQGRQEGENSDELKRKIEEDKQIIAGLQKTIDSDNTTIGTLKQTVDSDNKRITELNQTVTLDNIRMNYMQKQSKTLHLDEYRIFVKQLDEYNGLISYHNERYNANKVAFPDLSKLIKTTKNSLNEELQKTENPDDREMILTYIRQFDRLEELLNITIDTPNPFDKSREYVNIIQNALPLYYDEINSNSNGDVVHFFLRDLTMIFDKLDTQYPQDIEQFNMINENMKQIAYGVKELTNEMLIYGLSTEISKVSADIFNKIKHQNDKITTTISGFINDDNVKNTTVGHIDTENQKMIIYKVYLFYIYWFLLSILLILDIFLQKGSIYEWFPKYILLILFPFVISSFETFIIELMSWFYSIFFILI